MRSLVISIFLYACETWTLTAELKKKIQTTEMRCFRRLLGISYRDHVTNEKVGNRIRQAIGPYEDLLTTVKEQKLRWYGHKTRSTGLAKMILQGIVQGGRRRGRQKKRWEDNVTEWTGLKLGEAFRKAENREEWRTVVARSSLVPQWSTRLRDKWSEVKNSFERTQGFWVHFIQGMYNVALYWVIDLHKRNVLAIFDLSSIKSIICCL